MVFYNLNFHCVSGLSLGLKLQAHRIFFQLSYINFYQDLPYKKKTPALNSFLITYKEIALLDPIITRKPFLTANVEKIINESNSLLIHSIGI